MKPDLPHLSVVIGAAASGKSTFAERLVENAARPMTYIATAQAYDDEMRTKIATHQARRSGDWQTIEAPLDASNALLAVPADHVVLLDCVTLWLTNHLLANSDLLREESHLLHALQSCDAPVVVVTNEVGAGIVPDNALSRRFRAAQGRLNQSLAARADCVVAVIAGLPLALKGALPKDMT
ncbi:MAG: bifunctional adenosylcobinamide kinase/adenosylcobinamide-phosphate guanylyltransferase [Maritimibacter sp.]